MDWFFPFFSLGFLTVILLWACRSLSLSHTLLQRNARSTLLGLARMDILLWGPERKNHPESRMLGIQRLRLTFAVTTTNELGISLLSFALGLFS